jgi:dCMP deaminase
MAAHDTKQCLGCSKKIVQMGISEVVYGKAYGMDEASFQLLQAGGVRIRQHQLEAHSH